MPDPASARLTAESAPGTPPVAAVELDAPPAEVDEVPSKDLVDQEPAKAPDAPSPALPEAVLGDLSETVSDDLRDDVPEDLPDKAPTALSLDSASRVPTAAAAESDAPRVDVVPEPREDLADEDAAAATSPALPAAASDELLDTVADDSPDDVPTDLPGTVPGDLPDEASAPPSAEGVPDTPAAATANLDAPSARAAEVTIEGFVEQEPAIAAVATSPALPDSASDDLPDDVPNDLPEDAPEDLPNKPPVPPSVDSVPDSPAVAEVNLDAPLGDVAQVPREDLVEQEPAMALAAVSPALPETTPGDLHEDVPKGLPHDAPLPHSADSVPDNPPAAVELDAQAVGTSDIIPDPFIEGPLAPPVAGLDTGEAGFDLITTPPSSVDMPRLMRVLVAEDNKTNRLVIEKMLKHLQIDLTFAENGQMAVDLFQWQRPDLLFTDISMPKLDGKEAARRIRAIEGDAEEILAAGIDHYLTKPVKKADLVAHILENCPEGVEPVMQEEDQAMATSMR